MNPTGPEVRHPFEGKPLTREVTDENGNVHFEVTAAVLTPLRARIADELALWTAGAVTALLILYVMNHDPNLLTLLLAASAWCLHPLFEVGRKSGHSERMLTGTSRGVDRFSTASSAATRSEGR
jgi:hypothetical protein